MGRPGSVDRRRVSRIWATARSAMARSNGFGASGASGVWSRAANRSDGAGRVKRSLDRALGAQLVRQMSRGMSGVARIECRSELAAGILIHIDERELEP